MVETILVASDFEEPSRAAADWACALARDLGARVTLVHVFDLPIYGFPDGALLVDAATATRISDGAQKALDDEVRRLRERGARVEGKLTQGSPRDAICAAAQELRADLVVIGTHGRRGLARALLGSVAENVVRVSPVPVAVVHGGRGP